MKKIMAVVLAVLAISGISYAAIEEYYEEKPIIIQKASPFDSEKQVKIRIGKDVSFKITVFQDEFFGYTTISANASIDNKTQKKVKVIYSIAFFDKDGKLVGCHQGSWDLESNDDVNYGSGIIYADEESIASIKSYKLRTQVIESKEK